jgi:beta-N-acetylhexosaminidase
VSAREPGIAQGGWSARPGQAQAQAQARFHARFDVQRVIVPLLSIAIACSAPGAVSGSSATVRPARRSSGPAPALVTATPTFAQLIGQKLMVAMAGTTPSSDLLGRIGRGEVGGVILFGSNITTASALKALTTKLRNAAAAGGQPPLLIATDQEGGSV